MPTKDEVLETLLEVVAPFVPDGQVLNGETPLKEFVDSSSAINILLQMEARLNIRLGAADLTFDNFKDCNSLANQFYERHFS